MSNVSTDIERANAVKEQTRGAAFTPRVDIVETTESLRLDVDMPGVKAENVDIDFENGELRIFGRVSAERRTPSQFLFREYEIGDFYRAFQVSEEIDAENISARCQNGVLTLHLPKSKAARPRKIEVQSK